MRKRLSFRPRLAEVLEDRLVLSQGGALSMPATGSLPNRSNTPLALGPIGTLGDDFTEEYRFSSLGQGGARNWVEILHATREVSFGRLSLKDRGTPRHQGFAYDWAQAGATSTDMVQNQLPGLARQVA